MTGTRRMSPGRFAKLRRRARRRVWRREQTQRVIEGVNEKVRSVGRRVRLSDKAEVWGGI